MKPERLSKVLARAGIASRRASEELIFSGAVSVNGKIVLVPQTLVSLAKDRIVVDGKPISQEEQKVYYMLHKPKGYLCSSKPVNNKKLVVDLFKPLSYRLFTIGRLDRDTTGLLLVTNDGHFANSVIHPSAGLSKEYLVKTAQEIGHDHLVQIAAGTLIEGVLVKPKKVVKVRRGTLKITVSEGKKREVRLLVQNAGLQLLSLQRIRIGGLSLGSLPEGTWRPLTEAEKSTIFQS